MRLLVATAALALALPGCSEPPMGPDFPLEAVNQSAGPMQLRVTVQPPSGEVASWDVDVPPGRSTIGRVAGPPGDYRFTAAVVGAEDELVVRLDAGSRCTVLVGNPTVDIGCSP